MASRELPSAQQRRKLMADVSPQLGAAGNAYLEAGRWGEAMECFSAAGDTQGAARLAEMALQAGDLFYYLQAQRILDHEPGAGELAELARNAGAAGKKAFAASAENSMQNGDDEQ